MLQRLRKRANRIINDKRIEFFEFAGSDNIFINSNNVSFHMEASLGKHYATNLDELEDFLFAVVRKDVNMLNSGHSGWRSYHFGLAGFNVADGTVTYGRASVLF